MAIEFVGAYHANNGSSGETWDSPSRTIDNIACEPGDLLLGFASNSDYNFSRPIAHGSFNDLGVFHRSGASDAGGARLAYKFAESSLESSGSWGRVGTFTAAVYRGVETVGTVGSRGAVAFGSSFTVPGISLAGDPEDSWVLTLGACFPTYARDMTLSVAPTAVRAETNGHQYMRQRLVDSGGPYGADSVPARTASLGGNGYYLAFNIELIATPPAGSAFFQFF